MISISLSKIHHYERNLFSQVRTGRGHSPDLLAPKPWRERGGGEIERVRERESVKERESERGGEKRDKNQGWKETEEGKTQCGGGEESQKVCTGTENL